MRQPAASHRGQTARKIPNTADTISFSGQQAPRPIPALDTFWASPEIRARLQSYLLDDLFIENEELARQTWEAIQQLANENKLNGPSFFEALRGKIVIPNQEQVNLANEQWHRNRTNDLTRQAIALLDKGHIQLPPNAIYMDIGCGEGNITGAVSQQLGLLSKNVYPLEITDHSSAPFHQNGLTIHTYDGKNIPDFVPPPHLATLILVLHHIQSEEAAIALLRSIHQKLPPGGYLLIREFDISAQNPAQVAYSQFKHQLSIRVARRVADMPPDTLYKTQEEWRQIAQDIGFKVIADEASTEWGGPFSMLLQK